MNIGSGIGGLPMIEDTHNDYFAGGPRKISPFFIPGTIINMISGHGVRDVWIQGPESGDGHCLHHRPTTASARRRAMIEYGDADVMVAGGAEATIGPLGVGGFCAARALSTRNDDPATASRPWDKDRDGFVIGEGRGRDGAGGDTSMPRRAARASTASSWGTACAPMRTTSRHRREDGAGAARSMTNALKNGGLNPDRDRLHQRPRHVDAARRSGRDASRSSAASATTRAKLAVSRPSR